MSIQSLGVGSGLALDDLVKQLIQAERAPKQKRLDDREESLDAQISGIGTLKSKMSDFLKSVDALRSDANLKGREPTITNPSENDKPFTAKATNSAVEGDYKVTIERLASGSRIETANAAAGGFNSNTDSVLSSGSGSLTFKIDASKTFDVNVSAGMTLQQLRDAVNSASDNFGVNASIVNTGTPDGGAKLVFSSSVTGTGKDLVIVNNNDLADLNRVSTTNSAENVNHLTPVKSAQNAKAIIDGIAVESSTNKFENAIENVSFTASEVSPKAADGVTFLSSTLKIGLDKEGVEKKIRDFVDNFNKLNKEIKSLTRYGQSELEKDGVLAGDAQVRGIQNGLAAIIGSAVGSSALGGLFQIGINFNDKGDLEIGTTDKFGLGSGEDRLKKALDENFDEIAKLFTDENEGIAVRMHAFTKEYTSFSGLLSSREKNAKDDKDQLADEREQFEMRMMNFEQILRDKYLNLDQTVAKLNQTGSALLASLGRA